MVIKKFIKKKNISLKNIQTFVPKNFKINVNPANVIEGTKKKIGNFYNNLKKERQKEKKR